MRTKEEIFQGEDPGYFLLKCSMNPRLWFERVLGMDIQEYHYEWIQETLKNRFVVIQAHRGSGKTYIQGFGMLTWFLWFGTPEKPGEPVRCLITSAAKEQSIKTMEEIMLHLRENELLAELMPDNRNQTWTKSELTTTNNSKVYCKAYGAGIRGYHVDYVLCDEGGEYNDHNIFKFAVSPTVNNRKGRICVIGTPKSDVDLLQELTNNPQYWSKKYPVYEEIDGKKISLWPSKFPLEEIENIRKRDGESSFQKEYLLNPRAETENALYPANMVADCFDHNDMFKSAISYATDEDGNIVIDPTRAVFIGCDFAIASGPRADFDSYVVVEKIGAHTNIIYGERHRGLPIHAKVARLKDLHERFKPRRIICDESNVGQAVIERMQEIHLPVQGQDFAPHNRNAMLISLRQAIEEGRITIPRHQEDELCMKFTNVLITEMVDFKETRTPSGLITYKSSGKHDDTVMSLCLALKGVYDTKDFLDLMAI